MTIKINNLIKKIYTKIKLTLRLHKTKITYQTVANPSPHDTRTKSPVNTLSILQQLEQIQASIQQSSDELTLT